MRSVSDGASFVGAQSLPREMAVRADGTVSVWPAAELDKLIVATTTARANLTARPGHSIVSLPQLVAQQARLTVRVRATGSALPASLGMSLHRTEGSAELRLSIEIQEGRACATIDPRQGCAPVDAPVSSGGAWAMNTTAELWLDNGLVEVFVGNGTAVLSAWFPRLYDAAAGLNGSTWTDGDASNATAHFALEWSTVASAAFHY
jgi:sucrose-6-phosphate hydrolase SacC (GH32 family)